MADLPPHPSGGLECSTCGSSSVVCETATEHLCPGCASPWNRQPPAPPQSPPQSTPRNAADSPLTHNEEEDPDEIDLLHLGGCVRLLFPINDVAANPAARAQGHVDLMAPPFPTAQSSSTRPHTIPAVPWIVARAPVAAPGPCAERIDLRAPDLRAPPLVAPPSQAYLVARRAAPRPARRAARPVPMEGEIVAEEGEGFGPMTTGQAGPSTAPSLAAQSLAEQQAESEATPEHQFGIWF